MRRLLTILFFLVGQFSFGQVKNIQIPTYRLADTSLWYIWTNENVRKIGLEDLIRTKQPIHFRFWTERQAIDIWTTDTKTFQGKFISYTKEYDPNKYKTDNPKPEKFYSKIESIDSMKARKVYEFLQSKSFFKIPRQDSIKGWSNGTDGNTYLIEYSTPTQYSFKDYWTPQIQKRISEAATIDTTIKYLQASFDMNNKWLLFINSLPKGCYHAGSLFLTCNNRKTKKKNCR